jgi:hypothetical protein
MARYHPSHLHLPFHLHVPTYFHAPGHASGHPHAHPHLGEGVRDSLWLFVALAILLGAAAIVQWLFSMM